MTAFHASRVASTSTSMSLNIIYTVQYILLHVQSILTLQWASTNHFPCRLSMLQFFLNLFIFVKCTLLKDASVSGEVYFQNGFFQHAASGYRIRRWSLSMKCVPYYKNVQKRCVNSQRRRIQVSHVLSHKSYSLF